MSAKHKWHDEIVAWAGGAKIEWRLSPEFCKSSRGLHDREWRTRDLCPNLDDPSFEFRVYDKHREVKEAMARGELCQWDRGNGWVNAVGDCDYDDPNCWDDRDWRIAPKPDPYQHLRDAIKRGETVQGMVSFGDQQGRTYHEGWYDVLGIGPDFKFFNAPENYRVKPTPKPDYVETGRILFDRDMFMCALTKIINVNVTMDGDTGKPKSVELVK